MKKIFKFFLLNSVFMPSTQLILNSCSKNNDPEFNLTIKGGNTTLFGSSALSGVDSEKWHFFVNEREESNPKLILINQPKFVKIDNGIIQWEANAPTGVYTFYVRGIYEDKFVDSKNITLNIYDTILTGGSLNIKDEEYKVGSDYKNWNLTINGEIISNPSYSLSGSIPEIASKNINISDNGVIYWDDKLPAKEYKFSVIAKYGDFICETPTICLHLVDKFELNLKGSTELLVGNKGSAGIDNKSWSLYVNDHLDAQTTVTLEDAPLGVKIIDGYIYWDSTLEQNEEGYKFNIASSKTIYGLTKKVTKEITLKIFNDDVFLSGGSEQIFTYSGVDGKDVSDWKLSKPDGSVIEIEDIYLCQKNESGEYVKYENPNLYIDKSQRTIFWKKTLPIGSVGFYVCGVYDNGSQKIPVYSRCEVKVKTSAPSILIDAEDEALNIVALQGYDGAASKQMKLYIEGKAEVSSTDNLKVEFFDTNLKPIQDLYYDKNSNKISWKNVKEASTFQYFFIAKYEWIDEDIKYTANATSKQYKMEIKEDKFTMSTCDDYRTFFAEPKVDDSRPITYDHTKNKQFGQPIQCWDEPKIEGDSSSCTINLKMLDKVYSIKYSTLIYQKFSINRPILPKQTVTYKMNLEQADISETLRLLGTTQYEFGHLPVYINNSVELHYFQENKNISPEYFQTGNSTESKILDTSVYNFSYKDTKHFAGKESWEIKLNWSEKIGKTIDIVFKNDSDIVKDCALYFGFSSYFKCPEKWKEFPNLTQEIKTSTSLKFSIENKQ